MGADEEIPEQQTPLRVLIGDPDSDVRHAIREILQREGITVVAEALNGRDAVRMTRHYRPDVVLLNVVMPGLSGLSALEQIAADGQSRAKVIMLSASDERDVVLLALRKGALGYLNNGVDLSVLPRVLRDVAEGKVALSRSLTSHLVKQLRDLPEGGVGMRPVQSTLTAREWEVADLLCLGKGSEEIAAELVLATDTVRSHVKNIMRKLDVHSRADLVALIEHLRSGLVLDTESELTCQPEGGG